MTALYRFVEVTHPTFNRSYTFTLNAGDIQQLQLSSQSKKETLIALVLGEIISDNGKVEIAVDGAHWSAVDATKFGQIAWVAGNGGLISNLKVWENITLPLWYHTAHEVLDTERQILDYLSLLGLEKEKCADFMAAPPFTIEPWQRKLAGLLRALMSKPLVLVVDASVFDDVKVQYLNCWIAALADYAAQGHAVLVIADRATNLPWHKIE
jgi:phospholipid/cholesterol/gamma-HCH transport system ATP-binding protein